MTDEGEKGEVAGAGRRRVLFGRHVLLPPARCLLPASSPSIGRLGLPPTSAELRELAEVLVDAVESGAAVSFLATLTVEAAESWWRSTLGAAHSVPIVLVARVDGRIAGTVQLHRAWAPNQPHRGEIAKLLVHRRHRGAGLGRQLMQAAEVEARQAGLALLTLDAKRGSAAESLYRQLGWVLAGTIPQFAFDPDGTTPHDAVVMYRVLTRGPARKGER